jgi:hypothetical protein
MWIGIVGGAVLLGMAAWFRFVAPIRRLVRYLRADELGVHVGPSDVVRWSDLREIRVETTAGGPYFEDFWVVLHSNRRSVRIPDRLVSRVLPSLQRLPNFDNDAFIRATGSAEKATFLCWRSADAPSSS